MAPRRACVAATLVLVLLGHVVAALTEAQMVPQSDAACRIHWVAHMLRVPGCRDKRLLSLACKGLCRSYSVYMPETDDIHRSCNCCQATGSSKRRVRMLCADDAGGAPTRRFRARLIQVALPTGCMCRPCSTIPEHRVPDVVNPVQHRTISDYFTI